jgi:hypothetical protein
MDWPALRDYVHDLLTSSDEDKRIATLFVDLDTSKDVPLNKAGEWHHLFLLCCCGAVEDEHNYSRVTMVGHIQCHAARFVSFLPLLAWPPFSVENAFRY